jgi:pimeloyl-ACP methyl ester carboxylesterase
MTEAWRERRLVLGGIDVAVAEAGEGPPLLYLHGAGTVLGFDALLPLAQRFRLIVPHHPGFGASADDPAIATVHDYERHYLDLLDELDLAQVSLVGHSMGGWIAATLAISQGPRITALVLAAPFGLRVPEHPTIDAFTIPEGELAGYLCADPALLTSRLPAQPTPAFLADRYREQTSAARIMWEHTWDPSLARWLHRISAPTLLLWGERDRVIPAAQAPAWHALVPQADVVVLPAVGHLLFDETPLATAAVAEHVTRALGP